MKQELNFTKQPDGTWQASFPTSGTLTLVQVSRNEDSPLYLKVTTNDGANYAVLGTPKDYKDQVFQIDIAEGATVTVVSRSAVAKASYIASALDYYTKDEIDDKMEQIHQFEPVVASSLPTASAGTMYKFYFIPKQYAGEQTNTKEEWMTVKEGSSYRWEKIGETDIDLSDYVTVDDLEEYIENSKSFKGWFDSSSALSAAYPSPKVGDYAYIKGASASDPAAIYECATAGTWSDSGRTVDTNSVQTFATGEDVNKTYIDDTHLVNPNSNALPTAKDTLQIKSKLNGVTSSEIKIDYNEINNAYVLGLDGNIINYGTYCKYTEIELNNADKIRFLGYKRNILSADNSAGYAFGHYNNGVWVSDYCDFYPTDTSLEDSIPYEIVRNCPIGSTHFRTTTYFPDNTILNGFYIYLIFGNDIKDINLSTKVKTIDIGAEKITYKGKYTRNKHIRGSDGKIYDAGSKESIVVDYEIGNVDKVVFSGFIKHTVSQYNSLGYAFGYYHNNDSSSENNWVTLQYDFYPSDTLLESDILHELIIENKFKGIATHFRCMAQTPKLFINQDNFYCYFIKGDSISSNIGNISEDIPYRLENGFVNGGNVPYNPGAIVQNTNNLVTNYVDISQFDKLFTIVQLYNYSSAGYTAGYAFYDANKVVIGGDTAKGYGDSVSYNEMSIDVPVNAKYFRTTIRKEFSSIFYLRGHRKNSDVMDCVNKIEAHNIDYIPILRNLSFKGNFNLIHFSDIHSDNIELQKIVDFKNKHKDYITDAIHTGDNVWYMYSQGMNFWNSVDGAETILNCLGNHDTSSTGGWTFGDKTAAECRATFIEPYKDNWGDVVIGNNNECYYYKDYPEQNIRLIVLDLYHPDDYPSVSDTLGDEQQSWFENVLEDARTAETPLHVIVAGHCTERYWNEHLDTPFDDLQRANDITMDNRLPALGADTINAISYFIENGGNFVCYLSGHMHSDSMRKFNGHNNMLSVVIQNASVCEHIVGSDSSTGPNNTNARIIGGESESAFNIISVNTTNKILSIIRVGQNYDVFGRHLGGVCYDYNVNRIISQW